MNAYSSDVILINDGTGTRYENSDKRPTAPIRLALNIHASRENLYLLFHRYSMWPVSSSPIYEAQATSYYGSLLSHLRALSFSLFLLASLYAPIFDKCYLSCSIRSMRIFCVCLSVTDHR